MRKQILLIRGKTPELGWIAGGLATVVLAGTLCNGGCGDKKGTASNESSVQKIVVAQAKAKTPQRNTKER